MIQSFRHKGLRQLFEKGDRKRLQPSHVANIERILARLDVAADIGDMNLPGFRLHALTGNRRGNWSVTVSANWRIVFRFQDGDAFDVDLVDYH